MIFGEKICFLKMYFFFNIYLIVISYVDKIWKLYNLKRSDVFNYFFKFILCVVFFCVCVKLKFIIRLL